MSEYITDFETEAIFMLTKKYFEILPYYVKHGVVIWLPIVIMFFCWGIMFLYSYFPKNNFVEVMDISLGTLGLGEKTEIVVTLKNTGAKVHLHSIETSCGCISLDQGQPVILEHGNNELRFSFVTPNSPSKLEHNIHFFAKRGTPSVWSVKVSANVEATVWADPSSLRLHFEDVASKPDGTFSLYLPEGKIKSYKVTPNFLQCEHVNDENHRQSFFLSCDKPLIEQILTNGAITGKISFELDGNTRNRSRIIARNTN